MPDVVNMAGQKATPKQYLFNQVEDSDKKVFSECSSSLTEQLCNESQSSSALRREKALNIQFNPSEYGILNQYEDIEHIYEMRLSPTIVTKVHSYDSDQVSKIF